MSTWKEIKINGISEIEKLVGEFRVWEIGTIPATYFKVKVYENQKGHYTGFTNLGVKNDDSFDFGVGSGTSIETTLEDTINYLIQLIKERENIVGELTDEDFEWSDPDEF